MHPSLRRILIWILILAALFLGWRLLRSAIDRSDKHDASAAERPPVSLASARSLS